MKQFIITICAFALIAVYDTATFLIDDVSPLNTCMAQARNDGTYSRTNMSVNIYTEAGHPKGSYAVYLHHGQKYINFQNTWICIQGKSRFAHNGNWYVIK